MPRSIVVHKPRVINRIDVVAVATSESSTIDVPSGIKKGDILLLIDRAVRDDTLPPDIVPAGFTKLSTRSVSTVFVIVSVGVRQTVSYKVANGSEGGTSLTGMAHGPKKILLVLRANHPPDVVNAVLSGADIHANGLPASQTITVEGLTAPVLAMAAFGTDVGSITTSFEPTPDDSAELNEDFYIEWKLFTANPQNCSVAITEENGAANAIQAFYFQLSRGAP